METCAFELFYEKCTYQYKLAQDDERVRSLRVKLLLREFENDDLHTQVAQDDDFIRKVKYDHAVLKEQMKRSEASLETAQGELRVKAREIEILKVRSAG